MKFFLSCAYLGFLPKGGAFLAAALGIFFSHVFPPTIYFNIIFIILGTFFTHVLRLNDPKWIVLDELVGGIFIWTLTKASTSLDLIFILMLFTVLDTFKPFPIYYFDRKDHPFFVFLDDLVAAAFGAAIFHLSYFIFNFFSQKGL